MKLETGSIAPAVTVLMPTFDQAAFIQRALESLLDRSFADWELVIIDDGSTDGTRQRIEPYLANGRTHYRRRERNGGLGAALNQGLAVSQAPLIAYLPSDDLLAPGHLHLHANVDQERWVSEFSQYDAGWLHFFESENQGDIRCFRQMIARRRPRAVAAPFSCRLQRARQQGGLRLY